MFVERDSRLIPSGTSSGEPNDSLEIAQPVEAKIDSNLEKALTEGPSSLIEKAVERAIQRAVTLGEEKPYDGGPGVSGIIKKGMHGAHSVTRGVLQMFASPKAAWDVYKAFAETAQAQANVRRVVAQSALRTVEIAETDVQKDVVLSWIKSLQETYRPVVPSFCQEQGWEIPREGTIAEMNVLMRIHGLVSGVERYRREVIKQMQTLAIERATTEGEIELAKQKNELLPELYDKRKDSLFNERRIWFQGVSHRSSQLSGTPTSFVTGLLVGFFEGIFVGSEKEASIIADKAGEEFETVKDKAIEIGRNAGSGLKDLIEKAKNIRKRTN